MVPASMRVPVEFAYVFPHGVMFLGVEPVRDFDAKGGDSQARDRDSGVRLWQVRVMDMDPEAGRFGTSTEVKVKIAAEHQPVPPPATVPGYRPLVEFTGVTITPYVDTRRRCTDRCRGRLAWSIRAESMTAPASAAGKGNGRTVTAAAAA